MHKAKYDQLYKSSNQKFNQKNRYPETLPFDFNRVVLTKPAHSYQRTSSVSMTPSLRPKLGFSETEETKDKLFSARHKTSQFNDMFAPPQEAKEIFIDKNGETNFDNYINASYCNSSEHLKLFIAAQAPKQNTAADFMQMIFENNVGLCLMVTDWFIINDK